MTTLHVGLGRWATGIIAAIALAGCGGQAKEQRDDADTHTAGSASVANTGGGGSGSVEGLPACKQPELLSASASISDADGAAKAGTGGKLRVTVTKVEQEPASNDAQAAPTTLHYTLQGAAQSWRLDATLPGLASDLIKEGDVLDFQLETSPGYIPLTQIYNQGFGLFTTDGELLLFGSHMFGHDVLPDLAFLGLEVSDSGQACGSGSVEGGGCQYRVSTAHFSSAGHVLDLQPGHAGQLGNLFVEVEAYQVVVGSGGACDDSGRSTMVGVKMAAAGTK